MSIFLRSDIELKDYLNIMGGGKVKERLRNVLIFIHSQNENDLLVSASALINSEVYPNNEKRTTERMINRDLHLLLDYNFITKFEQSDKDKDGNIINPAHKNARYTIRISELENADDTIIKLEKQKIVKTIKMVKDESSLNKIIKYRMTKRAI